MRTSKAIREGVGLLLDEAEGIVNLATTESRELTDDETKRLDAIRTQVDADIAVAERLEAVAAQRARTMLAMHPPGATLPPDDSVPVAGGGKIIIPANVKRFKKLKAFKSEEDAYACGQWILAAFFHREPAVQWCKEHGIWAGTNPLTTTVGTLGGVLVPDQLETAIIDLREDRGVFRRYARVRPMTSDTLVIPRRTGGLTAYYVGDNEQITASDKGWDAVTLTARKLAALAKYSSELNEDAIISIADDLTSEIAYAFADAEDKAGFLGDGTSTYGGIVGAKNALAAGSKYTAITGNTAFSTLDAADFESMVGKVPIYAQQGARWFVSKAGWAASMMRLLDAAGGNTMTDLSAGAQPRYLGYEVVWSQVLNSTLTAQTSTTGLVYFGDLAQAVALGSRRGISLMISADRYFEYDQLAIRGVERFDINVHETGDASNPGSLLVLVTPAS